MTVAFTGKFQIFDVWNHSDTNNVSTPRDNKTYRYTVDIADGSGDNQMQDHYVIQGSVSPGEGNEDTYDLAGGIVDVFGNTLTLATLKKLIVVNNATTSGEDITIGGPSAGTTGNLMTDFFDGDNDSRIKIKAGGAHVTYAPLTGYTITGGSADILVITNGGTAAISYDLILGGTR